MRRHLLGIISLIFIGIWAFFIIRDGFNNAQNSMALSICARAGFTMAAIWLAFPQLEQLTKRVSPWVLAGSVVGVAVLVCRPRLFIVVLPLLGVLLAMQFVKWLFAPLPDQKRRSSNDSTSNSRK